MIVSRFLFTTLLASASLTACLDDDASFGTESTDLSLNPPPPSVSNWSTAGGHADDELSYQPAMTVMNGAEFYVYASDNTGPFPGLSHALSWKACGSASGGCSDLAKITNTRSPNVVSLAAFNGSLVMIHPDDDAGDTVWMSLFDPIHQLVWPEDFPLHGWTTTTGSPAMAVFNNKLYFVGTGGDYPLWYRTMRADGFIDGPKPLSGHSISAPSLAVLDGKMYLATVETDHTINLRNFVDDGTPNGKWSTPAMIPAGSGTYFLEGNDVQIASVNGYLHLVHHKTSGDGAWWTWNRGCDQFPIEQQIPNFSYSARLVMNTGIGGTLALNQLTDSGILGYTHNHWIEYIFHSPATPIRPPSCAIGTNG